jgi:hypothetical protein
MSEPAFFVQNLPTRQRVTVFFRYILAYPCMLISMGWGYVNSLFAFLQWWIIVFTGKRNANFWRMQNNWLGYASRVWSYQGLLFDKWPNVGAEPAGEPTTYSFEYEEEANRLTTGFRLLMIIPALIVGIFVLIGLVVVTIVSWFAILFTGTHPQGMFDFQLRVIQYLVRLQAYASLMTDEYPKFGQEVSLQRPQPAPPSTWAPPPPPPPAPFQSGGASAPPPPPPSS